MRVGVSEWSLERAETWSAVRVNWFRNLAGALAAVVGTGTAVTATMLGVLFGPGLPVTRCAIALLGMRPVGVLVAVAVWVLSLLLTAATRGGSRLERALALPGHSAEAG